MRTRPDDLAADCLAPDVAAWLLARRRPDPVTGLRQNGLSSDALALLALGLPADGPHGPAPHDPSDLAACVLTVRAAPERLRPRMQPTLDRWRAAVAVSYDLRAMDERLSPGGAPAR